MNAPVLPSLIRSSRNRHLLLPRSSSHPIPKSERITNLLALTTPDHTLPVLLRMTTPRLTLTDPAVRWSSCFQPNDGWESRHRIMPLQTLISTYSGFRSAFHFGPYVITYMYISSYWKDPVVCSRMVNKQKKAEFGSLQCSFLLSAGIIRKGLYTSHLRVCSLKKNIFPTLVKSTVVLSHFNHD